MHNMKQLSELDKHIEGDVLISKANIHLEYIYSTPGPILLTWFNFNPSMDM